MCLLSVPTLVYIERANLRENIHVQAFTSGQRKFSFISWCWYLYRLLRAAFCLKLDVKNVHVSAGCHECMSLASIKYTFRKQYMTETHLLRNTLHSVAANVRSVLYRLSTIHIFIEEAYNKFSHRTLRLLVFKIRALTSTGSSMKCPVLCCRTLPSPAQLYRL